jgi:hypothetical protein
MRGRDGVEDILGDCGSPDPGSIPGPGLILKIKSLAGSTCMVVMVPLW